MPFRSLAALALLTSLVATPLRAQACGEVITRTAPGTLSGRRIDSVRVITLAPDPLPGPTAVTAVADRLHFRTQNGTIRRELLFAAGDTVDTLRIAESMRQLRRRRYIADAWLEAHGCDPSGGVVLTLTTRDTWSARPQLKLGSSKSAIVGLEERNLFGTGRSAGLFVRATGTRTGIGVSFIDPWIPHTNLAATLRTGSYRDGSDWFAVIETRRTSLFDRRQIQFRAMGSTYREPGDTAGIFARDAASLLVANAVRTSPLGATSVLVGLDVARGRLFSAPSKHVLGPATVRREFMGMALGMRRESARYDTLTWILPENTFAELPHGFEGEAVIGLGTDRTTERPTAHLDLWAGHVWLPGPGQVLVGDVWSTGFIGAHRWDAGSVRAQLSYQAAAPRGAWRVHLATERLFNPDPDTRALATLDPVLPLFPRDARLAGAAVAASAERGVYLRKLSRALALDGAIFTAFSLREDPVIPNPDRLFAGVIGLGLRAVPLRSGRTSIRLDVGYPVVRSPQIRARPYVGAMIIPWLGAHRERAGRRDP